MESLIILVALTAVPPQSGALAAAPTPDEYLARVKAVGEPDFDASRKREKGYLENYKKQQHLLYRKKAAILLELCKRHPDDTRYAEWMNRRWILLGWNQDPKVVAQEVLDDIVRVTEGETDPVVLRDAAYWHAYFRCHLATGRAEQAYVAAKAFVDVYPNDQRGADLLSLAAEDPTASKKRRLAIYRRLGADYSKTHYGIYAPGMVRRLTGVGKTFPLSFDDAITGRTVDLADMHGKIVVLDFWATTCAPCVAEMPHLKALYEEYHARGIEFIGISLDESKDDGGLAALRRFVDKHAIPWPQYYQGNGYDSSFSKSWGVGSAPTMLIVDRKGLLAVTDAQHHLKEHIKKLLSVDR